MEHVGRVGDGFNQAIGHRFELAARNEGIHVGLKLIVHILCEEVVPVTVVAHLHGNGAEVTPLLEVREEVVAREAAHLANPVEHEGRVVVIGVAMVRSDVVVYYPSGGGELAAEHSELAVLVAVLCAGNALRFFASGAAERNGKQIR